MLTLIWLVVGAADAQSLRTLHTFTGSDGWWPRGLVLSGSTLYGMTNAGGSSGDGTIFSVNADGTGFRSLFSFSGTNGKYPGPGSLTLNGSTLYGMTSGGGVTGNGTLFSINTDGTGFSTVLTFNGSNGSNPLGGLILDPNGKTLYGTTSEYPGNGLGYGTIFSVNTDGTGFKNLHSFVQSGTASYWPFCNLTQSGSVLFGMTDGGGSSNKGTIFSMNTDGTGFETLLSFSGTNGNGPNHCSLTLCESTLYGMTWGGGVNQLGNIFSISTDGTGFKNLYSFSGPDGQQPNGGLVLEDSTLYGTTPYGGIGSGLGNGTIFSINTDGSGFRDFCLSSSSARNPGGLTPSGLVLYGCDQGLGGNGNYGNVFALTLPEPSTFGLLAAGAIGLVGYVWRRRAARTSKPAALDQQDAPAILSFPSPSSPAYAARRAA